MTDVTPADLRAACDILADQPGGYAVARALADIMAGADPRNALGLRARGTGRSPLTLDRLARRDSLLRDWRDQHHPGASAAMAAKAMRAAAATYTRRLAAFDQALDAMPDAYAGTEREHLWRLARVPAEMPGKTILQDILSQHHKSGE